jgi:16S rRNA processing protein RimM
MIGDANTSPFVQIGQVVRAHGLHGELKIDFETRNTEAVQALTLVYLRNDRGDFYPARISEIRTEGKGNKISFFVQFDHIADRSSSEPLKNKGLYLEQDKAVKFLPDEGEQDGLLDYEVLDENSDHVGLVIDTMDSGAQQLITVATTSGSLLIPVVDAYVTNIDHLAKSIHCQQLNLLEDL